MPGVEKIYLPGEIEEEKRRQREAEGVFVEDSTWQDILAVAAELNVAKPE
jgi:LDH2 family malate/lactate/ureidoglycolate dehydrogenase